MLEFGNDRRPLEIDLLAPRGSVVRQKLADVIRENLSKIGIRVYMQMVLPNELVARLQDSFNYEAILFGFTPTDVAPDLQTDFWVSGGRNHFWHPRQTKPQRAWEADIDAQISKLVHSLDPAIRRTSFDRVQEIWASELPAIPTIAAHIITGYSGRVGNTRPSILAPHLLWNATTTIDPEGLAVDSPAGTRENYEIHTEKDGPAGADGASGCFRHVPVVRTHPG